VAVVVVNNAAGDPVAMATDGTADQPTVPAVMASLTDTDTLKVASGKTATLSGTTAYISTPNSAMRGCQRIARFSLG
jgi:minor extracellular serine protease Vpr